jgi:hypothetical protein
MSADVLQPSLDQREEPFGGSGLLWPDPHASRVSLQMPAPFPSLSPEPGGQIRSKTRPALVELAREWVTIILKPSRPVQTSVFDMPPLNLGRVLRPVDGRDDLLQEMLDDTRF